MTSPGLSIPQFSLSFRVIAGGKCQIHEQGIQYISDYLISLSHRIIRVEKDLYADVLQSPLPWEGTPFTRSSCAGSHPVFMCAHLQTDYIRKKKIIVQHLPGPLRKSLICTVIRGGGIPLLASTSPATVCNQILQ